MNWNHLRLAIGKESREILRDRRTLFLHLVLPALLYPLLALFLLQVGQVAKLATVAPPRLALIDAPPELVQAVEAALIAPESPGSPPTATRSPRADAVALAPADHAAVGAAIRRLAALRPSSQLDNRSQPESESPAEAAARAQIATELRRLHLACALWVERDEHPAPATGRRLRTILVIDDGAGRRGSAPAVAEEAVAAWKRAMVEARLTAAGLPPAALTPITAETWPVAARAEALRSALAGILPMLLALLATSGVFMVAVDLMAGERERGSLETLLSLPAGRRELFLGKLVVAVGAGVGAVALNLLSLAATLGIAASHFRQAGPSLPLDGLLSAGIGTLVLAFVVLVPVTILLGSLSLAMAGLAATTREAQNQLTPLLLSVVVAASISLIPDARPGWAMDLVPVAGPLLALRECLLVNDPPWMHLLLALGGSLAWAWVVTGWAVRLLDEESFCYPGLVRAGWGRWRRWGEAPPSPGALEALGLFALCFGLFIGLQPLLAMAGPLAEVAGPLMAALLLPVLLHCWLGNHDLRQTLFLTMPKRQAWLAAGIAVPFAGCASLAWLGLQEIYLPKDLYPHAMAEKLTTLQHAIGPVGLLVLVTITPGLCEEPLFRGTLLAGLRRGIGDRGAIVVTSFLFAAMHLSPWRFFPQFTLGIFLATLVLRTGSIWPAVVVHALHNGLMVLPFIEPWVKERNEPTLWALLALGVTGLWFASRLVRR
ncbi:sodium extrusion protein NatB [Planctomycetota bacterium]|nr:sodium extrusion protein NatB [Planctomycetota bacterium]